MKKHCGLCLSFLVLVVVCLGGVPAGAQRARGSLLPLVTARDVVVDREAAQVRFILSNQTGLELTAWAVRISVAGEPFLTMTRDKYQSGELETATGRPSETVKAGSTRADRMPFNAPALAGSVTVDVIAAIFADRTTDGDPEMLEVILRDRDEERRALGEAVPLLRAIVSNRRGALGLRQAARDIPVQPGQAASKAASIRAEFQELARRTEVSPADADNLLARALEIYELQLAAAVKHARRK